MYIITKFVIFLCNIYVLYYVYLLKTTDCGCAKDINDTTTKDFKRDFIYYYTLFYVFLVVSFFTFPEFFLENKELSEILKLILGILLLVNIYCMYFYSRELRGCDCADSGYGRLFMEIFSIFYIVIMVLMFLFILLFFTSNKAIKVKIQNNELLNNIINDNITIITKVNKMQN